MVNETVKTAYVMKLTNLSPFQSLQEDFPVSSSDKDGEESLPTATRCYRFDDSDDDDDDAYEDETMVSLMKPLKENVLPIRAKLQFSSSFKEVPVLCILFFLRSGSSLA